MSLKNEIRETKHVVEVILRKNKAARDNDELLICLVIQDLGFSWKLPFYAIMEKISLGELPSFETITRARRKLQEIYPELRGKNWKERNEGQEEYINLAKGEI